MPPFRDEHAALEAAPPPPAAQGSPIRSLLILASLLGVGGLVVIAALVKGRSHTLQSVPSTLEPSALESVARAMASRGGMPASGELVSIQAFGVAPGGSIHVAFGSPGRVAYEYVGATLGSTPQLFETYTVMFDARGQRLERSLLPVISGTVPAPHCRFADIWTAAQAAGAPPAGVATIQYADGIIVGRHPTHDPARAPHWTFTSAGFEIDVSDADCTAIR